MDHKWEIFKRREKKIKSQLERDAILYGMNMYQSRANVSLWEKLKYVITGGSPFLQRIDPTKAVIKTKCVPAINYWESAIDGELEIDFYDEAPTDDD